VNNLRTDATILGAEFLTLPKTDGVTVNLIASANQLVFVEYGTVPGQYTLVTKPIDSTLASQGANAYLLSWTGGYAPYRVQTSPDLSTWTDVNTTLSHLYPLPTAEREFFRFIREVWA
jgi:hypothetical protein